MAGLYFDKKVEDKIIEYQTTGEDKVFEYIIYPAFYKISSSLLNIMKKPRPVIHEVIQVQIQESLFLAENYDMISNKYITTNIVGEILDL